MNKKAMETRTLTGVALFTAIVVVLQLLVSFIRFGPFSISLVLLPIVVGAALYGPWAGAWLGLAFGAAVLLSGDAGAFLALSVPGTVVTVLLKGALAGLAAGVVFRAFRGRRQTLAATTAAAVCPVVNTGVFLLGCLAFFLPSIRASAGDMPVLRYMILFMVGGNFLVELLLNLVLSGVILRLIRIGQRRTT